MFLDRAPMDRMVDARETRVFALIVGAFEGKLPAESRLASLFQVSVAEARSMIQGAWTRYQHRLRGQRRTILGEAFAKIPTPRDSGNGHALVVFESSLVVKELNQIIAEQNAKAAPIRLAPGTSSQYVVKQSAYLALESHFRRPAS